MNRLKSSTSCRICRTWLERLWSDPQQRESAMRQMNNGMCDQCQRERQSAAVEYIRAADDMRLLNQCLLALGVETRGAFMHGPYAAVARRVHEAEQRCVSLLMWPRSREMITPERFRASWRPSGPQQPRER
jgi:hypothetical protein